MKKEFLKIAGVKNEKDFYELFPTEEIFFSIHPEAFKLIEKNIKSPTYEEGGYIPDLPMLMHGRNSNYIPHYKEGDEISPRKVTEIPKDYVFYGKDKQGRDVYYRKQNESATPTVKPSSPRRAVKVGSKPLSALPKKQTVRPTASQSEDYVYMESPTPPPQQPVDTGWRDVPEMATFNESVFHPDNSKAGLVGQMSRISAGQLDPGVQTLNTSDANQNVVRNTFFLPQRKDTNLPETFIDDQGNEVSYVYEFSPEFHNSAEGITRGTKTLQYGFNDLSGLLGNPNVKRHVVRQNPKGGGYQMKVDPINNSTNQIFQKDEDIRAQMLASEKQKQQMKYGGLPSYQVDGEIEEDEVTNERVPPIEVFNPSYAASPFFSRNVSGNVSLGNIGRRGASINAGGSYDLQNKNYSVNAGATIPTRKAGTFSAGADYSNDPMWGQSTSFNIGYNKELKKGPRLGINLRYSQQSEPSFREMGEPSFRQMGGPEVQEDAQQEQGGGGEQEIINFVAQSLMQGEDPKNILEALVSQMGLQQEQAMQLIQAIAQKIQEQSGNQQQAQQPMMKNGGYSGTYDAGSGSYFKKGGHTSPQEGEVYDMDEEQIQRLINLGYKIKYM